MGAWGPAIFSDDTACDIRSDYRELLEDGVDDAEATQRVISEYQHLGDDEVHVLWLALAAAQSGLGRLDDLVKAEALRVIDGDVGLELWVEAGARELASRKAALAKLRKTLRGPQKPPSKVRRPWSHVTDLSPGDVLACTLPDGKRALFRVATLDAQRVGTAPIVRRLEWARASLPSGRKLAKLKPLPETRPMDDKPSVSFCVARHRKKDEDWRDVGFEIVGQVPLPSEDAQFAPRTYTTWRALRTSLDNGW
ncbi:hypothetical protein EXE59_15960 [Nocardioides eburneiflavus]|uniref:DUF4259 domain-containing protein n=1 Tax=Nocardioides eburneiflavus TaxID=2518372 RepID=A0A4Z1CHU5_9ACTN|nr:hypothetical protein [Nocardioides eburneiflavus]TGN65287.1 hypothetical protein EXE59_15960 [Nocardioides eburneiflavus]